MEFIHGTGIQKFSFSNVLLNLVLTVDIFLNLLKGRVDDKPRSLASKESSITNTIRASQATVQASILALTCVLLLFVSVLSVNCLLLLGRLRNQPWSDSANTASVQA